MSLLRLPPERALQITRGDLGMAALIGFVGTPMVAFGVGLILSWIAPGNPVAHGVTAAAGLLTAVAPVALLGALPGIAIMVWLRTLGWVGLFPVIAAGACIAALPAMGEPSARPLFAGFGAFYAGMCWFALYVLRRDVFAAQRGNE